MNAMHREGGRQASKPADLISRGLNRKICRGAMQGVAARMAGLSDRLHGDCLVARPPSSVLQSSASMLDSSSASLHPPHP